MAADRIMSTESRMGDNITLCISGDIENVKKAFTKISQGGKIGHQLKSEFFGTYGDCQDKFGINWMFQSDEKLEA